MGPWKAHIQRDKAGRDLGWIIEHENGRIGWASLAYADTNKEAEADDPARAANAHLIAACHPAALRALLDLLKAAGAENERLRAALRPAMDALLASVDIVEHEYVTDWRHGMPTRKAQLDAKARDVAAHKEAIEIISAALENTNE
jgi:hypothetical protein